MHRGSCLCSAVKYEINGELGLTYYCHCSRCRKESGSAFAANAVVAAKDFVVVEGEESLATFRTGEGVQRLFCSRCGSPLLSRRDSHPDMVSLRLGTLDTPLPGGLQAHIFVASRAEWFEIHDQLPQHPGLP
jgi:hypothetical protein